MAAETIKEFLVGLGFKIDEMGLSRFAGVIAGATASVVAFAGTVNAAALAAAYGTKKIAEEYEDVGKLAERFRTTTEEVDAFMSAAKALGVETESAKNALQSLNAAMGGDVANPEEAAAVFSGLGIAIQDAEGDMRSASAVMAELMTKLDGLDEAAQRTALETLEVDVDTFRALGTEFANVAAEVSSVNAAVGLSVGEAVKRSQEFNAAWKAMQAEINSWRLIATKALHAVAVQLMPLLRDQLHKAVQGFAELRRRVMEYMPRVVQYVLPVAKVVQHVLAAFTSLALRIARAAVVIIGWIVRLNAATNGWLGYIALAIAAWKTLNLAFLMTPIGMLVALATIIALLVDDFLTWTEQGESLIDWSTGWGKALAGLVVALTGLTSYIAASKVAIAAWGSAVKGVAAIKTAFTVARGAVLAFNAALLANPIGLIIAAVAALAAAAYFLVKNWDTIKEWFAGFFAWLAEMFPTAAGFVKGAAQKIGGYWGYIVSGWERARTAVADALEWLRDAFAPVIEAWRSSVGILGDALSGAGEALGNALAGIRDSVTEGIEAVLRAFYALRDLPLDEAGQLIGEALVDALSALGGIVVNALAGIGGAVVSVLGGVFRAIAPLVLSIVRSAAGAVMRVVASIPGAAVSIVRLALSAVANLGRALVGVLLGILGALTARLVSFVAWVAESIPGVSEAFRFAADVIAVAGNFIKAVWQSVRVFFAAFLQWLSSRFSSVAEACRSAVNILAGSGQALIAAWERVRTWFSDLFSFLSSGFARISKWTGKIGGAVTGAWNRVKGVFSAGTPASAPAPQTQVKLAGGGQNISQNTTINVTGAQNPNATARAISNAQRGVNADMARNLSGATL